MWASCQARQRAKKFFRILKVVAEISAPVTPSVGLGVLHLFGKTVEGFDAGAVAEVVEKWEGAGSQGEDGTADCATQIVTVEILGHKADLGFMILDADFRRLRQIQTELAACGLAWASSYVSLTEISEYAAGVPEEMRQARLYPQLPPEGKPAWCFYPMSKRRGEVNNWFRLPYEERKELMYEHGASGRKFSGRVLQVVTGSTGIDDYEWGVTLFCQTPDDLKEVVYTLRYDEGSALYGEFGSFWTGVVTPARELANKYS